MPLLGPFRPPLRDQRHWEGFHGRWAAAISLCAAAYRPVLRGGAEQTEAWHERLSLGEARPTLPLALRANGCVPVDLESTYMEARRRSRLA